MCQNRKKPVYHYPEYVSKVTYDSIDNKRYWLNVEIDKNKLESILIILKNPSRATDKISDKTVFNVTNYIYKNKDRISQINNIGNIVILNLIPNYETYSKKLQEFHNITDQKNFDTINEYCEKYNKVIVAWGDHPRGLKTEYNTLKEKVHNILSDNNNLLFYVDKISQAGNPKHGQIWGYNNVLCDYTIKT